ncbi:MAG: ERF family protein [Saprospiraceae bacterium]
MEKIEIAKALVLFQSKVPVIYKSSQGYNYKYADLAEIKRVIQPHMAEAKLSCIQFVENESNEVVSVTTMILHESGQSLQSTLKGNVTDNQGHLSNIQAQGSVITYLRRYGMSAMLGLVTDADLDGSVDSKAQNKLNVNTMKKEINSSLKMIQDQEFIDERLKQAKDNTKNTNVEFWTNLAKSINNKYNEENQDRE